METAKLPSTVETSLGLLIYQKAQKYFENPENREKFEEWHLRTYGVPYVWKVKVNG